MRSVDALSMRLEFLMISLDCLVNYRKAEADHYIAGSGVMEEWQKHCHIGSYTHPLRLKGLTEVKSLSICAMLINS